MKEEIKVGDYIRTHSGSIVKIITGLKYDYWADNGMCYTETENAIKDYSSNIIDLIEVGDVIQLNGTKELKYEVLRISYSDKKGKHIHIINPFRTEGGKDIFIEDIKSIVTKEQFKEIEYKVQ